MNNKHYLLHTKENNIEDYNAKGIYAQSPTLAFLHEVVISYLQELSFYLLQLKELGITNDNIKNDVIDALSGIVINIEYNQQRFYEIIIRLYTDLAQAKDLYTSVCKRNTLQPKFMKSTLKNPEKLSYVDAISQGQKFFFQKFDKFTPAQMNLFELTLNVLKSVCINLVELKDLSIDDEKTYTAILLLLSLETSYEVFSAKNQDLIKELIKLDHDLLIKLDEIREERYGQLMPKEISCSTKQNKAILVSGTNLRELELLLEATKNKGIDIYTHGRMVMAHAFPKLKKYPHLVGHVGEDPDAYMIDFSEFPGPIFMTKHSFQRVDHLYRSRIFTTDTLAPRGATRIYNRNFQPLIDSALSANGYAYTTEKPPLKIDINEKQVLKKIADIAEKIAKGEIKHFITIGVSNHTKQQKEYFDTLLKLIDDDCFVLSFSYTNKKKNVLLVESDYGFPLLYKTLAILTKKLPIEELNPIILFTRCEPHTVSNVLYLKEMGIKKIYFNDCSSSMINPALTDAMKELFDIKSYTNPQADLKDMLAD